MFIEQKFKMIRLLFPGMLLFVSSVSYGQARNKTDQGIDTSRTAVIKFNQESSWIFDSSYKAATLTNKELLAVDSFLLVCVTDYNKSLNKDNKRRSIDLKGRHYRKQLIVVVNEKGQKEVWVNCFCNTHDDHWKTQILSTMDGGTCYFNFKINLTLKMYYSLVVNGVA